MENQNPPNAPYPGDHISAYLQANPTNQPMTSLVAYGVRYSGPLPPAEQLKQYEDICPGAADRIIRMAEKEQTHKVYCREFGLHCGIVMLVFILVLSGWVFYLGYEWAAGVILAFLAICGVLVGREDSKSKKS